MGDIFQLFIQGVQQTSWLEWVSVLAGVIQVFLSKENKVLTYPFGIISILTAVAVLYPAKLYAEMILQGYYLVMSVYGWWFWTNKQNEPRPITYANRRDWKIVLLIILLGFFLLHTVLQRWTDSDVPIWDAWVSCTAWAGMWLLAKRKIENWILLNISNLFAVPLFIYKELYLFALLTAVLFTVAVFGYLKWTRIVKIQRKELGDETREIIN